MHSSGKTLGYSEDPRRNEIFCFSVIVEEFYTLLYPTPKIGTCLSKGVVKLGFRSVVLTIPPVSSSVLQETGIS